MIIDKLILKLDSIIKDPISFQLSALPFLEFWLFFSGLSLHSCTRTAILSTCISTHSIVQRLIEQLALSWVHI